MNESKGIEHAYLCVFPSKSTHLVAVICVEPLGLGDTTAPKKKDARKSARRSTTR